MRKNYSNRIKLKIIKQTKCLKNIITYESNRKWNSRQDKRKTGIPFKQVQQYGGVTGNNCAKIKFRNQRDLIIK